MIKKIGILGGSFDPVHYGHLILAEQIRSEAGLDEVVLVPARISPFKLDTEPAAGEDRFNMLKLAIEGKPGISVSDVEIESDEPSYTYETLCRLQEQYGEDARLYFIVGSDSIEKIDQWYKAEKLLSEFSILVGCRKGQKISKKALKELVKKLKTDFQADMTLFDIPELEISSSDLRERYCSGKSIRYLVPDSVLAYMNEHRLYRDLPSLLKQFAKEHEKETRFRHTCGVVQMSVDLAKRYNADPYKSECAAWFHDAYRSAGNLIHGQIAAESLEKDFNVTDPDILDAIRFHTTGRPGMGLYEKILRIADNLEINRDYPGVEELRASVTDDVNETCHMVMSRTRDYVHSIGGVYVDISNKAIDYLENLMESEKTDDK